MLRHDLRMALAAMVAFGPVLFAAAYSAANASKLEASAPTVASAPAAERRAAEQQVAAPKVSNVPHKPKKLINASLDQPRSKHQKTQLVQ